VAEVTTFPDCSDACAECRKIWAEPGFGKWKTMSCTAFRRAVSVQVRW